MKKLYPGVLLFMFVFNNGFDFKSYNLGFIIFYIFMLLVIEIYIH